MKVVLEVPEQHGIPAVRDDVIDLRSRLEPWPVYLERVRAEVPHVIGPNPHACGAVPSGGVAALPGCPAVSLGFGFVLLAFAAG